MSRVEREPWPAPGSGAGWKGMDWRRTVDGDDVVVVVVAVVAVVVPTREKMAMSVERDGECRGG